MTAPELKPCPFCGGEAVALTGPVKTLWGVTCLRCACWMDDRADTADEAVAAWNRRADLAAVQPAQVRVKPLVWGWSESLQGWRADCELTRDVFCAYETNAGWVTSSQTTGSTIHANADAAKSALDGYRAARILAALEPQPDPRDEVIARLVEALEYADRMVRLDLIHMTDFEHDNFSQAVVDTGKRIALALAAAKAVRR